MRPVAVFDFDGTLTRGDTFVPFLQTAAGGARFAGALLRAAPTLTRFALGRVPNDEAKEVLMRLSLGGKPLERLRKVGERYAREVLPRRLRPAAVARLHWHQAQGHRCIVISASPELYITPWAEGAGCEAAGTRLEVDAGGRVTGAIDGENCYGPEKVRRLLEMIGTREGHRIYAYGDSRGDCELLELADHGFYRRWPEEGNR